MTARTAVPPTGESPRCANSWANACAMCFATARSRAASSRAAPPSWSSRPRRPTNSGARTSSLMTRSRTLTEDDLHAVARDLRLDRTRPDRAGAWPTRRKARVDADVASSHASGVRYTPTFFINGERYDGPWDEASFTDAMLGSLGHRVRIAALGFASWAPSTGVLLLLATLLAVFVTNSRCGRRVRRVLADAAGPQLRRRGFPHAAAALGQRRAADRVLPGRRARDQARIHRGTSRLAAQRRAAHRRGDGRHGGARSYICVAGAGRGLANRLGRAHGHGHRLRRGVDRHDGRARAGGAAHLPDRGRDRR